MSKSVLSVKTSTPIEVTRSHGARVAAFSAAAVLTCIGSAIQAQSTAQSSSAKVQTSATAAPLPVAAASVAIGSGSIDGRVDEAAWARATPITDFHQQQPNEGGPPSEKTEGRGLFADHALYIGGGM